MMTDPIADMLTRIRNGLQARHNKVDMPCSRLKTEIARILKQEGYIQNFKKIDDRRQGVLRIYLARRPGGEGVIEGLTRVSRPGCRIYCGKDDVPRVQDGLGINILSTPKGLMTGKQAVQEGMGGEILCNVW
ncbi:MAG: 30S ribosomal protein S8 [Acidobacteriota bacterium]